MEDRQSCLSFPCGSIARIAPSEVTSQSGLPLGHTCHARAKVWSAATLGIDAVRIIIEVDGGQGWTAQPGFTLVGLPDAAVRESYSRVRSALHNCGLYLPPRHITVNLSPADVRKAGSGFDLPIAIGILHALEFLSEDHVESLRQECT